MNGREDILLKLGSVAAAAAEIGEIAASEALHTLQLRTPEELRGSWPHVIAYNRLQDAYEKAHALGLSEDMTKIAEKQAKMVKDMY